MPTRNVVLTVHQEKLITKLVESGCYQNASEVLRASLRLMERREAVAARLAAFCDAACVGFAGLNRGEFKEYVDSEAVENYLNALSRKAINHIETSPSAVSYQPLFDEARGVMLDKTSVRFAVKTPK